MNKYLKFTASAVVLSGLILITGCSSGGDSGTPAPIVPVVPANATVIDAINAEPLVQVAVSSATALGSALSVETTQVLSLKSAINIIQPLLKNISTANVAAGATFSDPCSGGGSISGSTTETNDGTTFTEEGTANFNNCVESGFTINGSVDFNFSENIMGVHTEEVSGTLTLSFSSESFSFSNLTYEVTGNNQLFTYTINQLTYSIEFDFSTESGGFLVTLSAPIVENSMDGDLCPESGAVKITGGNSTTAEGIYNGDGTMTIKANDAVINAVAFCYN